MAFSIIAIVSFLCLLGTFTLPRNPPSLTPPPHPPLTPPHPTPPPLTPTPTPHPLPPHTLTSPPPITPPSPPDLSSEAPPLRSSPPCTHFTLTLTVAPPLPPNPYLSSQAATSSAAGASLPSCSTSPSAAVRTKHSAYTPPNHHDY
jgi:hypothetical protein